MSVASYTITDATGPVTVLEAGTDTLATVYTDDTGSTQAPNPVAPNEVGLVELHADAGDYDLELPTSTDTVTRLRITVG